MNGRVAAPGKTRICPHCKTVILESASVCPGCQHHLRFDPQALVERRAQPTFSALRVEGDFRNPEGIESWEYSVVVSIRNEQGKEIGRKLIGVGAMAPDELRTFNLSVEVVPSKGKPGKGTRH